MRTRVLVAAVTALGLAACAQGSSSSAGGGSLPAVRLVGNVRSVQAGHLTAAQVGAAQQAFGLDVLAALCAKAASPNVTLSPSSLADMLGLADAGSVGATRTAMARLLHLLEWGDVVIAAQRQRTQALAALATDPKARVVISNHIWAQNGAPPTQGYLDDVRTAFGADLHTVDFAGHARQATDAINAAVDHDTDGLIKKLYDEALDPSTVDVLTNAVVLDAKWAQPFDPDSPDGTFHTADGTATTVKMMSSSHSVYGWTSASGWQAASLPYVGDTLEAVAMLPPEGSKGCVLPHPATLKELLGAKQGETVVQLPKLHLEQTHDSLLQTLAALGFPATGDFSRIDPGAAFTSVVQKVVMDVDEKGTKAAAATGGAMATSGISAARQVAFDRPFLFLIRDTATGSPLFLTWVGDPTQP